MGDQVVDAPRTSLFMMDPDKLTLVDKPGQYYDKRVHLPVDPYLVDSILTLGLIHAVTAVKDGDEVIVVAGRQRTKAAREAKNVGSPRLKIGPNPKLRIAVSIKRGDEIRMEGIGFAENEIRKGDDPLTRAEKMAYYLDLCGDAKQVGIMFGCTAWTVNHQIKVLDLCKPVKVALQAEKLSVEAALEFTGLSAEDAGPKLEALLAGGGKATASKARASVKGEGGTGGGGLAGPKPPPRKRLLQVIEAMKAPDGPEGLSEEALNVLMWSQGLLSEDELLKRERWMGEMFDLANKLDRGESINTEVPKAPTKGKDTKDKGTGSGKLPRATAR